MSFEDREARYLETLATLRSKLMESGVDEIAALVKALGLANDGIAREAPQGAEALQRWGRKFVRKVHRFNRGFERRLNHHWGDALDLFESLVAVLEQSGGEFMAREGDDHEREALRHALTALNAQAVRTSKEVLALLRAGFPMGALALARTVHEIAVRAWILSDYGQPDKVADLAERFLLHHHVVNYKDAVIFQRDAEALDYEPLDDATIVVLKRDHDDLLARYGKLYGQPYGWAAAIPELVARIGTKRAPNFRDLEELCELDHLRGYYQWASHLVHGDAKSLKLQIVERGGSEALLVGPTNTMLADPGQQALRSAYRTWLAMAASTEFMAFQDTNLVHVLNLLVDRADELFVGAERSVDAAEERLQAKLGRRGMRMDPVRGRVRIDAEG